MYVYVRNLEYRRFTTDLLCYLYLLSRHTCISEVSEKRSIWNNSNVTIPQ